MRSRIPRARRSVAARVGSAMIGLLLSPQALQAQTPATPPQRVEVTGSAANARRDAAAGQQVIDADELARHGHTRLSDALAQVPGLQVRGTGADLRLMLDGLSAEQTLVLVDGEPVPRLLVLEALTVGQVERVEIVRGANVQWSGRGLAGTINIVTSRRARLAERDLTLTAGSDFGRPVGQAELALGDRAGSRSWRVGLALRSERERYPVQQQLRFERADERQAGGWRVQLVEANHVDGLTVTPQWRFQGDDGRRLLVEAVASASRLAGAGEEVRDAIEGAPPRLLSDRLSYRHDRTLLRLRLEAQWPLASATLARLNASATRGRRDQFSRLEGHDGAQVQLRNSVVESVQLDRLASARAAVEHRAGGTHTLSAGLQLESNDRREGRVQTELIPSWEPDRTDEHYDARARSVALYAQDDWSPSRAFTLSWGARLERLQTRSEGNVFDGVRQRHQLASPMLNTLWRPDARTQWTLGLSRAYRLPEPRDIMPRRWTRPENSSLVPDFFGNPELRPESAWTLQGGWERRAEVDGGAQLRLGMVIKRIDDLVVQQPVQQGARYLLQPTNGGAAWVASLQARVQAEWARAPAAPVALSLGATAQRSRVQAAPGPDNRLPDQAPWELQAEASQRLAGGAWSWSGSWRWRAGFRAQLYGGRTLWRNATHGLDLSGTWQADRDNRWRLSVQALGSPDAEEILQVQAADGVDRLQARTRREPRVSLQWQRRL